MQSFGYEMEKVLCSLGARANGAKPASSCCAWLTRMLMIASAWALWPFSTIVRKLTTSGIPKSSQLLMRQMPSVTIMRQSLRRFVISTVAAGASVRTWAITSFTLGLSQKGSGPTGVLVGVCVGPLRAGASAGGAVVTTVGLNTGEMGVGVASGGVPPLAIIDARPDPRLDALELAYLRTGISGDCVAVNALRLEQLEKRLENSASVVFAFYGAVDVVIPAVVDEELVEIASFSSESSETFPGRCASAACVI